MADDYLGKKMEDYRRAGARMSARRSGSPSYKRPGYVQVPMPDVSAVVIDASADCAMCDAVVGALRSVDCRVLLVSNGDRSRVAQAYGARWQRVYTDGMMADGDLKVPEVPDLLVCIGCNRPMVEARKVVIINPVAGADGVGGLVVRGDDCECVGRLVRCLAELVDIAIFAKNSEIVVSK